MTFTSRQSQRSPSHPFFCIHIHTSSKGLLDRVDVSVSGSIMN